MSTQQRINMMRRTLQLAQEARGEAGSACESVGKKCCVPLPLKQRVGRFLDESQAHASPARHHLPPQEVVGASLWG